MTYLQKLEQAALEAFGPDCMKGKEKGPRSIMTWAMGPAQYDPEWWAIGWGKGVNAALQAFIAKHPTHPFSLKVKGL